jgi:hypothetical protein
MKCSDCEMAFTQAAWCLVTKHSGGRLWYQVVTGRHDDASHMDRPRTFFWDQTSLDRCVPWTMDPWPMLDTPLKFQHLLAVNSVTPSFAHQTGLIDRI